MDDRTERLSSVRSNKNQAIPPDKLDVMRILHNKGFSNREVGRVLELHHTTVGKRLELMGLSSNYNSTPTDLQMVSKTTARCTKCGDVKSIDEFQKGRVGTDREYTFSYCNGCRRKQVYLNLNKDDVRPFLLDRLHRLKRRCKKDGILCTLTKEDFIGQFQKQGGLCFYTDAVLICEVGSKLHRNSFSVDKLIPEKGYTKENTVFTTHRINTCKCDLSLEEIQKWMPQWSKRIETFLGIQMNHFNDPVWRASRFADVIQSASNTLERSFTCMIALSDPFTDDELQQVRELFPTCDVSQGQFATNSNQTFLLISSKYKPGDVVFLASNAQISNANPNGIFDVVDIGLKPSNCASVANGAQNQLSLTLEMHANIVDRRTKQSFSVPFTSLTK
jgi:hypothetical protein